MKLTEPQIQVLTFYRCVADKIRPPLGGKAMRRGVKTRVAEALVEKGLLSKTVTPSQISFLDGIVSYSITDAGRAALG